MLAFTVMALQETNVLNQPHAAMVDNIVIVAAAAAAAIRAPPVRCTTIRHRQQRANVAEDAVCIRQSHIPSSIWSWRRHLLPPVVCVLLLLLPDPQKKKKI